MGKSQRDKGLRVEHEIVELHEKLGIRAERVPLSGASRYQGNGSDVDIYVAGLPLRAEVKARKDGEGFTLLEKWLGKNDVLFLRRNRQTPLVVLPWETWAVALEYVRTSQLKNQVPNEISETGLQTEPPEGSLPPTRPETIKTASTTTTKEIRP